MSHEHISSVRALSSCKWFFAKDPERYFTRHRKLPFEKLIFSILALQGGTLDRELLDLFGPSSPSSSAFVQQRSKLRQETFESLFTYFTDRITENKTLNGLCILAVDGSSLRIPPDPNGHDSFYPGVNGQKPYNLFHINAMFDLVQNIYVDAVVQKAMRKDEFGAMTDMVDRADLSNALFIADRGYESYNVLAHIQEKKCFFLIRVKDAVSGITSSLTLPNQDEFDVPFHLTLLNKHSVRNLKYSLALARLHSKKADFILQEIFTKLIMYNFSSVITCCMTLSLGKKKYTYRVSFTAAVLLCRDYFLNRLRVSELEALLLKHILPAQTVTETALLFPVQGTLILTNLIFWRMPPSALLLCPVLPA